MMTRKPNKPKPGWWHFSARRSRRVRTSRRAPASEAATQAPVDGEDVEPDAPGDLSEESSDESSDEERGEHETATADPVSAATPAQAADDPNAPPTATQGANDPGLNPTATAAAHAEDPNLSVPSPATTSAEDGKQAAQTAPDPGRGDALEPDAAPTPEPDAAPAPEADNTAPSAAVQDDPAAEQLDPEADPDADAASAPEPEIPDRLLHMRWDMDKTYLLTEFDTLRDLYKTFMQRAEDKVAIAGASMLLKQLMNERDGIHRRVTFISGSPRQMRKVLTRKLSLDGIEPDVFILKPNLSNLLRGRFRALRGQVGYKLKALLHSHMVAVEVDEYLFGDDSEQDAFIYSVYADILSGRLDATALLAILNACKVYRGDTTEIMAMHSRLYNSGDVVRRIFIHLEARSPVGLFKPYGARVVGIYNYFQAALLLFEAGVLPAAGLLSVIDAMADTGYTPVRLANSLQDLLRRGVLDLATVPRVSATLANAEPLYGYRATRFTRRFEDVVSDLRLQNVKREPPPSVTEINYLGLYHAARFRRERYRLIGSGIRILD